MRKLLREYLQLDKSILNVITAEFFLQLINSSFLAILPLYMKKENYSDGEIANFTSYRFIGILVLALFVGIYIKGRKVKNLFYVASFCAPFFGTLILLAVHMHNTALNYAAQVCWGASFTFIQIPVIPYILRNCPIDKHTGAISLSYATWSLSGILGSVIISSLNALDPELFSERTLLHGACAVGFISIFFISRVKADETVPEETKKRASLNDFDWGAIIWALVPTLILAVGAGFTIPFISLFFESVHHRTTSQFAFYNLFASILIASGAMLVPKIKKRIGYQVAIPTTQSFAIIALVLMATTEFYSYLSISVWIAVGCFLLRQPLMNLAGPMTTEVVMGYVGKRNQEMVSALTASIWSGAWYFSGKLFGGLRNHHVDYAYIFLITAGLYTVGVIWYYFLVREYMKKGGGA